MKQPQAIIFDMYGVVYGHVFNEELISSIRNFRPRYKVGLLSNIDRSRLDELLADGGIGGLFDAVLASSETAYVKPSPEIYERICEILGVEPNDALYIDDSEDNAAGARAVGLRAATFTDNKQLFGWLAKNGVDLG